MKEIKSIKKIAEGAQIIVVNDKNYSKCELLSKKEIAYIKTSLKSDVKEYYFNREGQNILVCVTSSEFNWEVAEELRRKGAKFCSFLNERKEKSIAFVFGSQDEVAAIVEGFSLSNYQFVKYKTKNSQNSVEEISVLNTILNEKLLKQLNIVIESTCVARDLVNEPHSYLNSLQISEEFKNLGKQAGFKVEVWNEAKIEAQKMGGILAVNRASKIPPTFNIMEYKPEKAKNKQPIVLVGKGVVYDTGGLSLKPTPHSMDMMKCDMAGAAVVAGVMHAVAKLKLPLHVVGLVPATDNWIGENSYAPGDVITMYSGTTVEIMNTDAEGRLVLADALHFAKKLKPYLVCDFATLTGAAVRAIGPYASALLGTASDDIKQSVFESSYSVFERLVEFPLWQEYADELKSEIADMTNLGKGEGGQISAAKFLQHFVDYPWLHFDIAGPAFNDGNDAYRKKGGTGVGVRLMVDFLIKESNKRTIK